MRYTYSRWDGSQSGSGFDPEGVMEALSDDLMADGNLQNALQRLIRWGHQSENGRGSGLQNLLQRLRAQRQAEMERYTLDDLLQNIQERIDEIVDQERSTVQNRLESAAQMGDDMRRPMEMVAERKLESLDRLPSAPGDAIASLRQYEFLDDDAREGFDALVQELQQQVLRSHFQRMQSMLHDIAGEGGDRLKDMLRDLTTMARDRASGGVADFDGFMRQYSDFFPGVSSFENLLSGLLEQAEQTEALMESMTPDMRAEIDRLMRSVLRDEELAAYLEDMSEFLRAIAPPRLPQSFPFSGSESLELREALDLMRHFHDLDALEASLKDAQDRGDVAALDPERVADLMGEDAAATVDGLKQLTQVLEEAGYIRRTGECPELTARGIRRIGLKALQDIFVNLKRDAFGPHTLDREGQGGDRTEATKLFEFGDPFLLDLERTLMNAVRREGPGPPLRLAVDDFEVFRTEQTAQASTVVMLDMSRSMPLRGCFVAAKKVTLALSSLIRTQYPRDNLYVIGFSDFARELRPESLHQISWGDYVYGTNMQHGFLLARRLLARHKSANKQIILITDGEPTAHVEDGKVHFAYPPTFRTFQETLREVKRCTREGIVINTFMLERSHYLADFVNQMTRVNHGRAFFATPERLGDYVVIDYLRNRRGARG